MKCFIILLSRKVQYVQTLSPCSQFLSIAPSPTATIVQSPLHNIQQVIGSQGDAGTRAVYSRHPRLVEKSVVLGRDDSPAHHQDVRATQGPQLLDDL